MLRCFGFAGFLCEPSTEIVVSGFGAASTLAGWRLSRAPEAASVRQYAAVSMGRGLCLTAKMSLAPGTSGRPEARFPPPSQRAIGITMHGPRKLTVYGPARFENSFGTSVASIFAAIERAEAPTRSVSPTYPHARRANDHRGSVSVRSGRRGEVLNGKALVVFWSTMH